MPPGPTYDASYVFSSMSVLRSQVLCCVVFCTGGRGVVLITRLLFLQSPPTLASLPAVVANHAFVEEVRPFSVKISDDSMDRLVHSHGKCCHAYDKD